jgi:hypothetical protein
MKSDLKKAALKKNNIDATEASLRGSWVIRTSNDAIETCQETC